MFKRKSSVILIAMLSLIMMNLAIAIPAYACTPRQDAMDYTFADRVQNAPIILVGTVTDGEIGWGSTLVEVTVDVETYLKGEGYETVTIHGFGGGGDCRSTVRIGERLIFFANGEMGEILNAEYLGVYDAVYDARDSRIAEVISFTDQSSDPLPLPFDVQMQYWFNQYGVLTASVAVPLLIIVITAFVLIGWRRRTTRKQKAKRG